MLRQISAGLYTIFKPEIVNNRPIHLQIEPTTYCNLRCKSCPIEYVVKNPQHIEFGFFQNLIDEIRPQQVLLSGIGEPFTNPEIFKLIRYLKDKKATINLTTNGTLIADKAEEIIASKLDILGISIDAATPETYLKIRGKDLFDKIVDNIQKINELKNKRNSKTPFIRTHFVLQSMNIAEVTDFITLSKKLGVEGIYYQPLILTGDLSQRREILVGDLTYEKFFNYLVAIKQKSITEKITTNVDYIIRKSKSFWSHYTGEVKDKSVCIFPWFLAYVTVDGRVQPCCSFATEGQIGTLGNVVQEGRFMQVWNNPQYQKFRINISKGIRPYPVCQECIPRSLADLINLSILSPGFFKPLG